MQNSEFPKRHQGKGWLTSGTPRRSLRTTPARLRRSSSDGGDPARSPAIVQHGRPDANTAAHLSPKGGDASKNPHKYGGWGLLHPPSVQLSSASQQAFLESRNRPDGDGGSMKRQFES